MLQVVATMFVATAFLVSCVVSNVSPSKAGPCKTDACFAKEDALVSRPTYRAQLLARDHPPDLQTGSQATGASSSSQDIVATTAVNTRNTGVLGAPQLLEKENTGKPKNILSSKPEEREEPLHTFHVKVTAYSSEVAQTDSTPFITASNTRVRWGVIASNGLPFGTEVRLPELYGDQVFIVEDRMNARFGQSRLDVWMPSRKKAEVFGVKMTRAEVVAYPRKGAS